MKKQLLLALSLIVFVVAAHGQEIEKSLKPFNRIITSPHIDVVLKKGEKESIRIVYGQDASVQDKLHIEVSHKTLRVYLDGAKTIEKRESYKNDAGWRNGIYAGVRITAYITYKDMKYFEVRGEQNVTALDPISSREFVLKGYGENDIALSSLTTEYFSLYMYGENKFKVNDGKVIEQHYKLYGENRINTADMKCSYTTTNIFGQADINVYSSREIRISAFGEPDIRVNGGGHIHKRIILGEARIRRN